MKKYKCDICGRKLTRKHKLKGYVLCSKHMHQLHKHGKFLDNIQRTNNDLNDYVIDDNIATFNLYNQKNEKIGEFVIDKEDLPKVKYHKWRINHNHVVTGTKQKNNIKDLAWVVLGIKNIEDNVVDHINHDPFDNRKENLRICKQKDNTKNCSIGKNNTSGFVGVYWNKKRNRWIAEIKIEYKKKHLGQYKTLEEAVYARMIAEDLYFGEFKNDKEFLKKTEFTKLLAPEKKITIQNKIKTAHENYKRI